MSRLVRWENTFITHYRRKTTMHVGKGNYDDFQRKVKSVDVSMTNRGGYRM